MLTTPDSLLQSDRMRLAREPAALPVPGYRLDRTAIERLRGVERHLLAGGIQTDSVLQLHDRGVRFHEALAEGSGNAFFIDTIRRFGRARRLLSYRSMRDHGRYRAHAKQRLRDLLEKERNAGAAEALREHLQGTLRDIANIRGLLKAATTHGYPAPRCGPDARRGYRCNRAAGEPVGGRLPVREQRRRRRCSKVSGR